MDVKSARPDPGEGEGARLRLVESERIFRRLNERIEELNRVAQMIEEPPDAEQAAFLCECSRLECQARIEIDVATYAEEHSSRGRYIVVPGHETREIERIVARRPGYLVVEKER
jgi:hypothetical protein